MENIDNTETEAETAVVIDEMDLALIKPITLGDAIYSTLHLREPTAGEIAKAEKGAVTNTDIAISLISQVAAVPRKVIDLMCQRDFQAASDFLGGFTIPGQKTGSAS